MTLKNASTFALGLIVLCTLSGETQESESSTSDSAVSSDDGAADIARRLALVVTDPEATVGLGTDHYELIAAAITGDTLVVTVAYGGGCADHVFALDASGAFLESDPVQLEVALAHNANGDACEAWLTQDYFFSLAPLKTRYQEEYQQDSGAIVLRLAGAPDDLVYEFAHDGTTAVKSVSWGRIKQADSRVSR